MILTKVQRALQAYGVEYQDIEAVQTGYRSEVYPISTGSQKCCLIFYKNEPGVLQKIKSANQLSNYLANAGLPVRRTIDSRILTASANNNVSYACLYNYLPGSTIAWESYTMDHIKLVGKALALVHTVSANFNLTDAPNIQNITQQQNTIMKNYFNEHGVNEAMQSKLNISIFNSVFESFTRLLQKELSPKQPLHMDFVRGNLLFDSATGNSNLQEGKTRITGIIDFEKAGIGHINFDIARTLAFLVVDCKSKTQKQVYKYFLQSGYIKRGKGRITDLESLEQLTTYYLTQDFYKFLKHNPFESLHKNKHFVRTRNSLLQRGVLQQV